MDRPTDWVTVAFIIGPAKAGSTWLSHSLAAHSGIVSSYESHLGRDLLTPLERQFDEIERRNPDTNTFTGSGGRDPATPLPRIGREARDIAMRSAADVVLQSYIDGCGRRGDAGLEAVVDKSPCNSLHVATLGRIYPRARFIVRMRDPLDCIVSGVRGRVDACSEENLVLRARAWGRHVRTMRSQLAEIGPKRAMESWYEDHLARPESEIAGVLDFLGVDAGRAAARRCVEAGSFERLGGGRRAGEERDVFLRKGIAGDWRNKLGDALAARLRREIDRSLRDESEDHAATSRTPSATAFRLQMLRAKIGGLLEGLAGRPAAVFGAGDHTAMLLDLCPEFRPAVILDDRPRAEAIRGIPVRRPDEVEPRAFGAVVVSSDHIEERLARRAAAWAEAAGRAGPTPEIGRLYDGLPPGPYEPASTAEVSAARQAAGPSDLISRTSPPNIPS